MVFVAGVITALAAVAAFLIVSGGSEPAKRAASHAPAHKAAAAGVRVRRTKLGPILTDGQGRTLYLFEEDKDGHSQCFGACARVWPPALTTSATPVAGAGLSAAKLTTTRRGRSRRQLVYNGHPLYRMDADVRAGQMAGEGFLGTWWVVSPRGRRVVAPGLSTKSAGY
jgi:predicted lipoprotein with Yx(FWY)xxD motif